MKQYLVVLVPRNDFPTEGFNAAIAECRMYVCAKNAKEAKGDAVSILEARFLYMKPAYVREIKKGELRNDCVHE